MTKLTRRKGDEALRVVLNLRVTNEDYDTLKRLKPKGMPMGAFLRDTVMRIVEASHG